MPSGMAVTMSKRLTGALAGAALISVSLAAPAAAAVINGTSGPDVLVGTAKADAIHGFGGSDTLYGKAGNDQLYGGRGPDGVYGGGGADAIYGGRDARRDILRGGAGPDRIYAIGPDVVFAGRGNDRIVLVDNIPRLKVYCGSGHDTVIFRHRDWPPMVVQDCESIG